MTETIIPNPIKDEKELKREALLLRAARLKRMIDTSEGWKEMIEMLEGQIANLTKRRDSGFVSDAIMLDDKHKLMHYVKLDLTIDILQQIVSKPQREVSYIAALEKKWKEEDENKSEEII